MSILPFTENHAQIRHQTPRQKMFGPFTVAAGPEAAQGLTAYKNFYDLESYNWLTVYARVTANVGSANYQIIIRPRDFDDVTILTPAALIDMRDQVLGALATGTNWVRADWRPGLPLPPRILDGCEVVRQVDIGLHWIGGFGGATIATMEHHVWLRMARRRTL